MLFPSWKRSGEVHSGLGETILSRVPLIAAILAFAVLTFFSLPFALWCEAPQPETTKAGGEISQAAARALEAKIQILSNSNARPPKSFDPILITEAEASSYLKYHGQEFLPRSVRNPEIRITPERLLGAADVDFNELQPAGAATDDWVAKMLAWVLRGRQKVTATGRLDTGNGQAKLTIENVTVGTTPIPDWMVALLLQHYVQVRYNLDLSKPFLLPDHVTHIELGAGHATLYRSPTKNR